MSLMGIDIGTTGCKVSVFTEEGKLLAQAYEEYDPRRPQPGWAELDVQEVWGKIKRAIAHAAAGVGGEAVEALAISSMGEAVVPVSVNREILGASLLNFDLRGQEFLPELQAGMDDATLYRINGNKLANHFSLTKLKWIQCFQPQLYAAADLFLHWSGFVSFMLGADARVDYSLANRSLLFDLDQRDWSTELLAWAGLDGTKLPKTVPSGTVIGQVQASIASELGLKAGTWIVSGAHDQCVNAIGCGVIQEGQAVYGMGTYNCVAPVFNQRRSPREMMAHGLNTEHHAAPGCTISFIYNMGGGIVKWYRDTYAAEENRQAKAVGRDVYADLFAELPEGVSPILVYPHFNDTGFPEFHTDSRGMILGASMETRRGDILKGILEANVFSLKEPVDVLPKLGIRVEEFRASGGGSKSDAGLQICADILGSRFVRPQVTEAGTLGAAMLAGTAAGRFDSLSQAVESMVQLDQAFDPDPLRHERYQERYAQYSRLSPLFGKFIQEVKRFAVCPSPFQGEVR